MTTPTRTTTMTMDTMTTGDSDGGGCSRLFQLTACIDRVMGDAAYDRRHRNQEREWQKHNNRNGCGGGDCGGDINRGGGDNGGNGSDSGGIESNGGVGCGRSSSPSTAAGTGAAKTKETMKTITAVAKSTAGALTAMATTHDKRTRGGRNETTRGLCDGRQCNNQPEPVV